MSLQAQLGILIALAFVAVCWVLVVGHQLGWGLIVNAAGNELFDAVMIGAYILVAMSVVSVLAPLCVVLFKGKLGE
jgi:hypothetical protein